MVVTPDFTIDLAAKRVVDADGEEIRLTPTEWHIVEVLVRHAGKLVGAEAAAAGGVGPGVRDRDELPARLHGPGAAQARARARPPALLPHRAGHGLPLRARRAAEPRLLVDDVVEVARRARSASASSSGWSAASPCSVLAVLEQRRDQRDDDDHRDDRQQVLVDVVGIVCRRGSSRRALTPSAQSSRADDVVREERRGTSSRRCRRASGRTCARTARSGRGRSSSRRACRRTRRDWSTYSCLKSRESGRLNSDGPYLLAEPVADLVADDGGDEARRPATTKMLSPNLLLAARRPAVKSSESPGKMRPSSRPDSAKMIRISPIVPNVSIN